MEVILASSSKDVDICCWDLHTGAEQLRYKSCPSPSHGLTSIGGRYLASSQLASAVDSTSSASSVQYWSWNKPQSEVKSFPPEPINPIVSNKDGSFIIGGGSQGNIYLWEVARGRLLKKWHAHIRAVTCLVLSDDESLLISGAEDGYVRVWSLFKVFDDSRREASDRPYEHNLFGHSLRVTDVVSGHGGCNGIIVSSSEDRTCKVWSLCKGELLRSIDFPTIINAITLDPFEHVFYAGGNNGKIYIASLNGDNTSSNNYGLHIMGALSDHSKAVTCLTRNMKGDLIISGSEDQTIRIWDRKSQKTVQVFKHAKGPVSSVYVTRSFNVNPQSSAMTQGSVSRRHALLPPSLNKYVNSAEDNTILGPVITLPAPCTETPDIVYHSHRVMENQIKQLQQEGSSGASQMELEKLRLELEKSLQREEQWKKMYSVCVNELLDGSQTGDQVKATTEPLTPETNTKKTPGTNTKKTPGTNTKKKKKTKPEKSKKRKKTTS